MAQLTGLILSAALAVGAAPALAQAAPAQTTIPNTRHIEFVSKVNGARYAIDVALPLTPPPPQGYSVLYVLDGYIYFASAAEMVRGSGSTPATIVVAIGYPDDKAWSEATLARHPILPPAVVARMPPFTAAWQVARAYDLSLKEDRDGAKVLTSSGLSLKSGDSGGLDDFLRMIETEVKPRVAALAPIDRANQALFGHSLGGSAVAHALLTEPGAFRSFIIASPAISWQRGPLAVEEPAFGAQVASGVARPRVLVTVGADEEVPPPGAAQTAPIMSGMVRNACDFADRLKALHGVEPYEVSGCIAFHGLDHGLSGWPALPHAVDFAFRH